MISHQIGRVLITGAAGFFGANLCRFFADQGIEVVAAIRPSGTSWRLDALGRASASIRRIALDIQDPAQVIATLQKIAPSVVINCAAYGAYSSQSDSDHIYRVNFDGVRHVLKALRGSTTIRAIIQAGSSSEYGLNCTAPSEETPTIPDSDYAVSKVAATGLVQYYGRKHATPAWTLRLYSIYGPLEESSRLIPTSLLAARRGRLPPLVEPRISRDFLFVDDACAIVQRLVERAPELPPGEVFNAGSGTRTTLSDLVDALRGLFSIAEEPQWGSFPNRVWDLPDWYANPSKAERVLGWRGSTSLRDGLRKTMEWMVENPEVVETSVANSILRDS